MYFIIAFAKPIPVIPIIFGLGKLDFVMFLLGFVEIVAVLVYCTSVYARYAPALKSK